jgi:hypothetical protein
MDKGNTIDQFMWGWQRHFRISVETVVSMSLERVGAHLDPQVLLVGLTETEGARYPICIEPESGPLQPADLGDPRARGEVLFAQDPESQIWHSDSTVHEARQRSLHRAARGRAIAEAIEASAEFATKKSFSSPGHNVGEFEVHVVVLVDREPYEALPSLRDISADLYGWHCPVSLVSEVIQLALEEADAALRLPEPGMGDLRRSPQEIVRLAAEGFMAGCLYRTKHMYLGSGFEDINATTTRAYEGAAAAGRILLVARDHHAVQVASLLQDSVPLSATRGVRKLVQATDSTTALLVSEGGVYALGDVDPDLCDDEVFEITITAHATWELRRGVVTLLRVTYGRPSLPRPTLDTMMVTDTLDRVFQGSADVGRLMTLIQAATAASHGTTLTISAVAAEEAERLAGPATRVEPQELTIELLLRYAAMDGAILIDPSGTCHAFGVILDGRAHGRGDPSRGARYNSALRYEALSAEPTVVVVVSEDGGLDLVPVPRMRTRRQTVADAIFQLETVLNVWNPPQFGSAFRAVQDLGFYLSPEQAERVNALAKEEQKRRLEAGTIAIVWETLSADPDMDDSYFID